MKKTDQKIKVRFSFKSRGILFTLVLLFLILILTPAVIIGFISISTASHALIDNLKKQNERSAVQSSLYFDLILEKADYLSTQLFTNNALLKYGTDIDKKADLRTLTMDKQDVLNTVNNLNSASSDLNVAILYENGELLGGMSMSKLDMGKIRQTSWYKKAIEANSRPIWTDLEGDITDEFMNEPATTLVRTINSSVDAKPIGMMFIFVSYDVFTNPLRNLNIGKNDKAYIITNYGKVISSDGANGEKNIQDKSFIKAILNKLQKAEKGSIDVKEGDVNYLTVFNKSKKYGFSTVIMTNKAEITKHSSQLKIKIIVVGVVLSILAILVAILFSLSMSKRIVKIMRAMDSAENGDLTARLQIASGDEIGILARKFNLMIEKIKDLVIKAMNLAGDVLQSSKDLSAIATDSAKSSEEVANVMSTIASSSSSQVVEVKKGFEISKSLSDKLNMVIENISKMDEQSKNVEMMTTNGLEIVKNLSKSNKQTMDITKKVMDEIASLNENVTSINLITGILKDIAKQTKLLALNAAIEAAKSEASGKGFSVVATEIKKLAEQSDRFTKEIQTFISKILDKTKSTVELASEADIIVNKQNEIVDDTEEIFLMIYESISSMITSVKALSSYAEDIDKLKDEMQSSMSNISMSAQEVAASTQEVSASAQEQSALNFEIEKTAQRLNALASTLMQTIEKFKV